MEEKAEQDKEERKKVTSHAVVRVCQGVIVRWLAVHKEFQFQVMVCIRAQICGENVNDAIEVIASPAG